MSAPAKVSPAPQAATVRSGGGEVLLPDGPPDFEPLGITAGQTLRVTATPLAAGGLCQATPGVVDAAGNPVGPAIDIGAPPPPPAPTCTLELHGRDVPAAGQTRAELRPVVAMQRVACR